MKLNLYYKRLRSNVTQIYNQTDFATTQIKLQKQTKNSTKL